MEPNWRGYPMGENIFQLYIWPGVNNQNIQKAQETKLPQNKWLNEDMGKWTEYNFSKKEVKMAKKCMKKCSISLVIKELQIKTLLRFLLIPVRMAIIKNTNNK
jgi:hypothetical protein